MALSAAELVIAAKQKIREVDVSEAQAQLGKVAFLDVREPGEFAKGHLPNAINIPRGVLEFQIGNHPSFQTAQGHEFVVYCQSGNRSALAVESLKLMGYDKAVSLAGGFKQWAESGAPVQA